MMIPTVSHCCCGSNLEAGCTAIAWIHIMSSTFYLLQQIFSLIGLAVVSQFDRLGNASSTVATVIHIVLFLDAIASFSISIVFLFGIIKRRSKYVLIWIIYTIIHTIFSFVGGLGGGIYFAIYIDVIMGGVFLVFVLSFIAVSLYLIIVVINFRRVINFEKHGHQVIEFEDLPQRA